MAVQPQNNIFGDEHLLEERNRLRMLLDFDSSVNEAFFATRVCLVEGDCEIAALEAFSKKLIRDGEIDETKYLYARRDVTIIGCQGKGTIPGFQRVLNVFEIPYLVIHDEDGSESSATNARILNALAGDESRCLLHRPNFDIEIFNSSWKNDKPWRATEAILNGSSNMAAFDRPKLEKFFEFVLGKSIRDLSRT
ncbi:MAG: ATP-dependent endonuclease [Burkholderiales bacterium]|nr:ATP-dependent endonuclease [Anaerolineae bacterium]